MDFIRIGIRHVRMLGDRLVRESHLDRLRRAGNEMSRPTATRLLPERSGIGERTDAARPLLPLR